MMAKRNRPKDEEPGGAEKQEAQETGAKKKAKSDAKTNQSGKVRRPPLKCVPRCDVKLWGTHTPVNYRSPPWSSASYLPTLDLHCVSPPPTLRATGRRCQNSSSCRLQLGSTAEADRR